MTRDAGGLDGALDGFGDVSAREGAGTRPQGYFQIARVQAVAHAHAEDAEVGRPLREAQRAAQRLGRLGDGVVSEGAGARRGDVVRALAVEPQLERAALVHGRAQLQLVAVAPLALARQTGAHQLLGALAAELRRALERRRHVGALGLQLRVIGQVLPGASSAGRARLAARADAQLGGLDEPRDARAGERRRPQSDLSAAIMEARPRNSLAAQAADRLAAVAQPRSIVMVSSMNTPKSRFCFSVSSMIAYNLLHRALVAQGIERLPPEQKAAGSNPVKGTR